MPSVRIELNNPYVQVFLLILFVHISRRFRTFLHNWWYQIEPEGHFIEEGETLCRFCQYNLLQDPENPLCQLCLSSRKVHQD